MAGTATRIVIDGIALHLSRHLSPRMGITCKVSSMRNMMLVTVCVFPHTMTIVRSLHENVPWVRPSSSHPVILGSELQQQLHHFMMPFCCRSHEWSPTLVIPCMNIGAVLE